MAVNFRSVASGSGTGKSAATTLPAGWQPGDDAYLLVESTDAEVAFTVSAGWTLLAPQPTSAGETAALYHRRLQEGDAAPTAEFTETTYAWSIVAYSGVATGGPEVYAATAASGKSSVLSGVAVAGAGRRVALFYALDPPNAEPGFKPTIPAGSTERLNTNFGGTAVYIAIADVELGSGTYEFSWANPSAPASPVLLFAVVLAPPATRRRMVI